jgi:hypothetical protein
MPATHSGLNAMGSSPKPSRMVTTIISRTSSPAVVRRIE